MTDQKPTGRTPMVGARIPPEDLAAVRARYPELADTPAAKLIRALVYLALGLTVAEALRRSSVISDRESPGRPRRSANPR